MTKPFTSAKFLHGPWRNLPMNLWRRRFDEGVRKERKWAFPTRRERKARKMLARLDPDF